VDAGAHDELQGCRFGDNRLSIESINRNRLIESDNRLLIDSIIDFD
jgi:hypothetical protein